MSDPRISRSVPLDQLRQPETDVREHRPDQAVKSLAASMGDPAVGQLQDVLVHPVHPGSGDVDLTVDVDALSDDDLQDLTQFWPPDTGDDLDSAFRADWPMRIVDGETRRLAAERLGWATLDATIVPEPPEDTVVAQLDANTERIEMDEYETARALYDYYHDTDATLDDIQDKTGFSTSYLSQVFKLFDAPDWLREPWRHPDHPLETGHARATRQLLSPNTIKEYAETGNLSEEEARQQAVDDAQLMVGVQADHDLQVGEYRNRIRRCKKETLDQLRDQRSMDERQADGQRSSAEQDHTPTEIDDPDPCMICGGNRPNRRKFAIDVCREDYGMLSEMQANGDILMAQSETPAVPPGEDPADAPASEKAAEALSQAADVPKDQALALVKEVQQQAAQQPQEAHDD